MRSVEQTGEEKMKAVENLKNKLEQNFVELAQLLSEIKKERTYRIKGYKNFKEYIETEHAMTASFANKLIKVYKVYIQKLQLDEETVKKIGLDKLNIASAAINNAEPEDRGELIDKAYSLTASDLREEIRDLKDKQKEKDKTAKVILVEQYLERALNFFNCSKKELNFKLALYFQDKDLSQVYQEIKETQQKFEDGVL